MMARSRATERETFLVFLLPSRLRRKACTLHFDHSRAQTAWIHKRQLSVRC